jgi:hypothetical protein
MKEPQCQQLILCRIKPMKIEGVLESGDIVRRESCMAPRVRVYLLDGYQWIQDQPRESSEGDGEAPHSYLERTSVIHSLSTGGRNTGAS